MQPLQPLTRSCDAITWRRLRCRAALGSTPISMDVPMFLRRLDRLHMVIIGPIIWSEKNQINAQADVFNNAK